MTGKVVLHHVPHSRSTRVLWLLNELGIDCKIETYRIADGSLRNPDYLERSPAGRVPALEIDGKVLFESGAIVEYLCETRPESGLARMPGDPERAEYLSWSHFAETQASIIADLNLQWVFLRDPAKRSELVLKLNAARLAKTLDPLEKRLADQGYILKSGFSGADIMFAFNLFAVPYFVRLEPYPNLRAYQRRISQRPAYQKTLEIEGPQKFYAQDFYEVADG